MKQYVLIKGNLAPGEKMQVDGPRDTPFTEEANALNADHFAHVRKHWKGHYEGDGTDRRWVWDKEYIWLNKEIKNE
ncbi:MAG: hypothetical protein NWE89_05255 [Candidatus Bathyarchaeota archaeon]|nr:hypothetical protein [Candidatus Bathyarchaeota archaeon]